MSGQLPLPDAPLPRDQVAQQDAVTAGSHPPTAGAGAPPGEYDAAEQERLGDGPVGILPGQEILRALAWKRPLIVNADPKHIESASYDLRVGTIFWEGDTIKEQVVIPPGGIVIVLTKEDLDMPADMVGTTTAINALSREGLLVLNPGHIDAGYRGPLTVRLINIRKTAKALSLDTPVFTILFERLPAASNSPYPKSGKSRAQIIRELNDNDVQQNPVTLTNLVVKVDKDSPFPTKEQLKESAATLESKFEDKVRQYWMTRVTFFFSVVAAIGLWVTTIVTLMTRESAKDILTLQRYVCR